MKYYIILLLTLIEQCLSFNYNTNMIINRRMVLQKTAQCAILLSTINHKKVFAEENKPLTPAEMEEYKKLLIEAQNIQNIIDANKKAFLKDIDEKTSKISSQNKTKT